jgi:peptidoglycan/LPS O-acetylase OafA/YrhL
MRYRRIGILCSIILVTITVFPSDSDSFFVKTLGFTFLYLSFSFFLLYTLLTPGINQVLDKVFGKYIVNIISKIGLYSYSIYVIHTAVNNFIHTKRFATIIIKFSDFININERYFLAVLSLLLSVFFGMLMTKLVENSFLNLRNKYFPARTD